MCAMRFMCRIWGACFMWSMWELTRQPLISCVSWHARCVLRPVAVVAGRGKTGTRRNEEYQETRSREHQERQYLPEKDKDFVGEHLLDRQAGRRFSLQNLYLHPHIHLESSKASESTETSETRQVKPARRPKGRRRSECDDATASQTSPCAPHTVFPPILPVASAPAMCV
jgi:hypothetical protein